MGILFRGGVYWNWRTGHLGPLVTHPRRVGKTRFVTQGRRSRFACVTASLRLAESVGRWEALWETESAVASLAQVGPFLWDSRRFLPVGWSRRHGFFLFMVRDTVSAQGVSRAMDTPFVSKTGCVVAGASKRSGHSCRDCRASCRSVLFEWFSLQSRCIGDTGSRDEVSPAFWYPIGIARCLTLLLGFLSGGDGRIGVGLAFWLPRLL